MRRAITVTMMIGALVASAAMLSAQAKPSPQTPSATDKLEIFGNFGLQNRIDADALFQAGFQNDYPFVSTPWETGVGDVKLGLKYKFLDDYMGDGIGLAVRGYAKLPTADEAKGLGTGKTSFVNFVAADDFGRLINPMIVEGQVHGGLAQGIGQALLEGAVYDDSGQPVTASFMDYAMPRADDRASFKLSHTTTLCPGNPLGVKGCGEVGAIGSSAAVINAITDAIGHNRLEMPATRLAGPGRSST